MQHKITPAEASIITKLVTTLQPGWNAEEFLSKLADVREQHDFPEFMAQLTQCALAGMMIDDALLPVQPHVCPTITASDDAWLAGAPVVVNEDDITKSVLLAKKKRPESEIVRPPSDDPDHWRNKFAHKFDEGVRQRIADLEANRAEQLPPSTSRPQSAPAAVAHTDSVPDPAASSPELFQPVPNQQAYSWGPDDFEDYHDR
jgi:hypothetical protein